MAAVHEPLTLPNGRTLPNRLAKAAMEENLAGPGQVPGEALMTLYRRWATSGAALLITGNVMVDRRAMTGPGGVVLDEAAPLEPFRAWAAAAKQGGAHVWVQINHPGRQVFADMPGVAWAPSEIPVDLGRHSRLFARPTAMSEGEIAETVARFATTARLAEEAGFDGVQVHAAHGYLLSQFLSPLTNRRTDVWGGTLRNRARLLLDTVTAVRKEVSPGFTVTVKLNSADFQRGGFDSADAREVLGMLDGLGVDLVELSGGSVESPAMQGRTADERTLEREAYFLEFAEELLGAATMPVMVTGGVTRRESAERIVAKGVDMVGMATALALVPDLPRRWLAGDLVQAPLRPVPWRHKVLVAAASLAVVRHQLHRLARGLNPAPATPPALALVLDRLRHRKALRRYRAWLRAA